MVHYSDGVAYDNGAKAILMNLLRHRLLGWKSVIGRIKSDGCIMVGHIAS